MKKRASLFKNKQTKPVDSSKQKELQDKLDELYTVVEKFESNKIPIPQAITDEISDIKSKINPNKINAKKSYYNGREFDSAREMKFAKWLDELGLVYKETYDEEFGFELQPSFKLHGKTFKPICIYPDFKICDRIIVDIKGYMISPQAFKDKWKMLQYKESDKYYYFVPENDTQVKQVQEQIKLILKNEKFI